MLNQMYLIFLTIFLIKKNWKNEKKICDWGVRVFCEWRHKWRTFRPPWPTSPGLGPKTL